MRDDEGGIKVGLPSIHHSAFRIHHFFSCPSLLINPLSTRRVALTKLAPARLPRSRYCLALRLLGRRGRRRGLRGLLVLVVDLAGRAFFDDCGATAQALEVREADAHAEVD